MLDIKVAITHSCFFGAFAAVFPNLTLLEKGAVTYDELRKHQLVIVPGGADLDPAMYGEKNTLSSCDPQRDQFEVGVVKSARTLGIPVYGSCRGAQLLAVMDGSQLTQDIGSQLGVTHGARHSLNYYESNVARGPYAELPVLLRNGVNSLHHQGVPEGLRGNISPIAQYKGVLELYVGKGWLGTQFHPEIMDCATEFFTWLVESWIPTVVTIKKINIIS